MLIETTTLLYRNHFTGDATFYVVKSGNVVRAVSMNSSRVFSVVCEFTDPMPEADFLALPGWVGQRVRVDSIQP